MRKVLLAIAIGIGLAVFLTSCSKMQPLDTGKAVFDINISGAKTFGYDITRVHIEMTHENGLTEGTNLIIDSEKTRAYGTVSGLKPGIWSVVAKLYENETEVGSGSTNVEIKAGKTTEVVMNISFKSETNNGAAAESGIIWQRALGGSNVDEARSIQQTSDGGYIVAGYTLSNDEYVVGNHGSYDAWVVKLDSSGNIIWKKILGGSGADMAYSVQQVNDGGYILAGYTDSNDGDVSGNHGGYDAWIIKLDESGNVVWQRTLGGSNSDGAYSIQQTFDGGYIVAGYTSSNDGDVSGTRKGEDFWIVKLSKNGNIVWQNAIEKFGDDEAQSVQQTNDGGYIVVGYTVSSGEDLHKGGKVYWVIKLDSSGNTLWKKEFGGTNDDIAQSVQQTNDGGYIVAGYTWSNIGDVSGNHGGWDYWVIKLDENGNLAWQVPLGGSDYDYAYSVQQTSDGGYIVAGQARSSDKDVSRNHGGYDAWVVKLDKNGNIVWEKAFGGTNYDGAFSVQQASDGNYVMAGYTSSNDGDVPESHGNYDFWIVKFADNRE